MTAAELLSVAAFDEGRLAQAFPGFGSERTGAARVTGQVPTGVALRAVRRP